MATRNRPHMVRQTHTDSCWAAVLESWSRSDSRVGGGALRQQALIDRWGEGPTGGITPASKIPLIASAYQLQMPTARFRYVTAFLERTLATSYVFCVYFDGQSGFMHTVLVYSVENGNVTAMDPNRGPARTWTGSDFEAYGSYNVLFKA